MLLQRKGENMLPQKYVILYLIYGLAFINLGISALQQVSNWNSNFRLVNNIRYLGYFGIAHGLTELVTMLTLTELYSEYYIYMFLFNRVFKALSFVFLFIFGVKLVESNFKKYLYGYILVVFSIWLLIFTSIGVRYGFAEHIQQPIYNIIFIRYFMALPAGVITFIALITDSNAIKKTNIYNIAYKYRALAIAFLIYGILDGLIVRNSNFFPANIINNDVFRSVFGIPIQAVKTIVGVTINILFLRITYVFNWERDEKIHQLTKSKVVSEERRRLGREIHDNVIQNLYGAGLGLELLIKKNKNESDTIFLQDILNTLNESIKTVRNFMIKDSNKVIDVDEFKENIEALIDRFSKIKTTTTSFNYKIYDYNIGNLTTETATQIYYIIQEALSNIAKHSNANKVEISLVSNLDFLEVFLLDNGKGFDIRNVTNENIGLRSMQQRAEIINSELLIHSEIEKGTEVKLTVPWGEINEKN